MKKTLHVTHSDSKHRRRLLPGAAILSLALIAGACSSGDDVSTASTTEIPEATTEETATTTTEPTPEESASPTPDEPDTCPERLADIEMTCGQLIVPVDHDAPAGDTFSLPYAVLPALTDSPAEEPLVFMQGGPGFSTLSTIPLFAHEFSEFRRDRDMIFLEQRGTDPSGIFLNCDPNLATLDDVRECRDSYVADGIDLSAFTTLNAAKDLALLRDTLGIDQWHLLGGSYGTTLAMVLMDTDPDGSASVILDAPTAPEVIIYEADIESLLNAYSNVFDDCAADAVCDRRNPDLFNAHLANFEGLAVEPWDVAGTDLAGLFGPMVNHDSYFGVSTTLLQGRPDFLPAFVTAVAEQDVDALLELIDDEEEEDQSDPGAQATDPGFAQGLNYSIYCAEEEPFFDRTDPQIDTVDEWPAGTVEYLLQPVEEICEIWDVEPADPSDVDQIVSAIPTLILAGEYDFTTPLRQGEIAAAGLSDVELLEVPSTGHTTLNNECARIIMVDFLRAPGGDRSCLADIAPIEWR